MTNVINIVKDFSLLKDLGAGGSRVLARYWSLVFRESLWRIY